MKVSNGLVTCTGALLIAASLICLIVVGVLVTRPYLDAKDWKQAICTITRTSTYQFDYGDLQDVVPKHFVPCVGEHTAKTMYDEDITLTPCTYVEATYTHPVRGQTKATLYSDIDSVGYDTWNVTCSMILCKDGAFMQAASDEATFLAEFGVTGLEHTCYYSETDTKKTIAQRYSQSQVLAGMLAPTASFLVGVIVVLVGCVLRKRALKG